MSQLGGSLGTDSDPSLLVPENANDGVDLGWDKLRVLGHAIR